MLAVDIFSSHPKNSKMKSLVWIGLKVECSAGNAECLAKPKRVKNYGNVGKKTVNKVKLWA